MKCSIPRKLVLFTAVVLAISQGPLFGQTTDRYFDKVVADSKEVRLTVFFPTEGLIETLAELKRLGFITPDNLTVVGVYHEKEFEESTDYRKSREFAAKRNLNWMKFHKVSGELTPNNLFEKNPCTAEFDKIFKKSDGVIFFGGDDIPASIYGEKTSLLTSIQTPYRHFLELSFIFHLLGGFQNDQSRPLLDSRLLFPVIGFCLGCQSLNVGTGGSLVQDIWSETYQKTFYEDVSSLPREAWHRNPFCSLFPEKHFSYFLMHPISLDAKGKFCRELGFTATDKPCVLSAHHQAVGKLGKGMKVAATSTDGKVIEAIEHERYANVLGVQFHPEYTFIWDEHMKHKLTPDDIEAVSFKPILEKNPPSIDFHKKLWAWFCSKLTESHSRKIREK